MIKTSFSETVSDIDFGPEVCYSHMEFNESIFPTRFTFFKFTFELCHEKKRIFAYAKTKAQISFADAKLISTFVFATRIVQSFFFPNQKFQAFSLFQRLYRRFVSETQKTGFLTLGLIFPQVKCSPPRHCGALILPALCLPVPFCGQGFLPPPLTSALVRLVL